MFPNLRLIIGATVATMILVMIMGSGLFSFRDPQNTIADIPEVRRPLVQRAIVGNPDRQQVRMLAYARRNDELQRLLELPAPPVQGTPPSVTDAYPFDVMPEAPGESTAAAPAPQNAAPDAVVAALPPPPEPAQTSAAAPNERPAREAPVAAEPGTPPAFGKEPEPTSPPLAALTEVPDEPGDRSTGSVPESAIPAVEQAPLPRLDPRSSGPHDTVLKPSQPTIQRRHVRPNTKRIVHAVRLPARRPQPPQAPPAAIMRTVSPDPLAQPSPSNTNAFDYRSINVQ